ncbi:MAG TPA: peptidoglycan editing factor PgeF [Terriglobales bacterium]|nr:peptidoglycan editing factor PgeF [Terriglobales bacterium]
MQALAAHNLSRLPWLVHGFSTRWGGVSEAYGGDALNLGITSEDTRQAVEENRRRFALAIGAARRRNGADPRPWPWPIAVLKQIHSPAIHFIEKAPSQPLAGDGLITRTTRLLLTVRVADCLPVLLADEQLRAVAAFHAGWRGTLARIVEKGVGEMRRHFGSNPRALLAAIGPGVHRCCYEVEEEFRDKFAAQFDYADALFDEISDSEALHLKYPMMFLNQRAPGHGLPPRKVHLDLVEANRRQLMDAGIPPENIEVIDLCTSCRTDLLFSHRAEKGLTGRMMGAIGIRPRASHNHRLSS